ncbi:hypothetical protein V1520DRAFT_109802 [Lipomyces starkeyi]|uniref:BED-type domain-containing protein n=1 Tax=Lipomyces starkeyi NRRL Y-11557 TaxID=675824 RepID=A0A1E3PX43_LIPST|nr:hypothetical protein LIPSTDRAFT_333836 [Lipomyces starkeyi NRRL Y-11557]
MTPADSTSAESPQEQTSSVEELSESSRASDQSSTPLARSQNPSLWSHFNISYLPGKLWYPKRGKKGPIEDREIRCAMCNWKTTDSARATSTSNMKLHVNRHGIPSAGSGDDRGGDDGRMRQQSVATMFRKSAKDNVAKTLGQNLVRWMVLDDMAFMAIEFSAVQQIFNDLPGCLTSVHLSPNGSSSN